MQTADSSKNLRGLYPTKNTLILDLWKNSYVFLIRRTPLSIDTSIPGKIQFILSN